MRTSWPGLPGRARAAGADSERLPLHDFVKRAYNLAPSAERRAPSAERRAPSAERRAPSAERRACVFRHEGASRGHGSADLSPPPLSSFPTPGPGLRASPFRLTPPAARRCRFPLFLPCGRRTPVRLRARPRRGVRAAGPRCAGHPPGPGADRAGADARPVERRGGRKHGLRHRAGDPDRRGPHLGCHRVPGLRACHHDGRRFSLPAQLERLLESRRLSGIFVPRRHDSGGAFQRVGVFRCASILRRGRDGDGDDHRPPRRERQDPQ